MWALANGRFFLFHYRWLNSSRRSMEGSCGRGERAKRAQPWVRYKLPKTRTPLSAAIFITFSKFTLNYAEVFHNVDSEWVDELFITIVMAVMNTYPLTMPTTMHARDIILMILRVRASPNPPPKRPTSDSKAPILIPPHSHTIPLNRWALSEPLFSIRR